MPQTAEEKYGDLCVELMLRDIDYEGSSSGGMFLISLGEGRYEVELTDEFVIVEDLMLPTCGSGCSDCRLYRTLGEFLDEEKDIF